MDNSRALLKIAYLILIFLIGFILGLAWNSHFKITGFIINSNPKLVPSDFIKNKNIIVYSDKVVIEVQNAQISSYDSTGSMIPVLGEGANGIAIKPNSADEINVGEIVSFKRNGILIVHRVIEKGLDEKGVYFITKGDNSLTDDGKVRFEEIERILVGVIY